MAEIEMETAGGRPRRLFLPSRKHAVIMGAGGAVMLALGLIFRFAVIENTPLGIACDAGEESLICTIRLGVILLFVFNIFGAVAVAAAVWQVWRPNAIAFGIAFTFALIGIVLYGPRASALALALLILSLARPVREAPSGQAL